MLKLMNKVFFYAKIFFLLIAFSFVLYISFMKMEFASSNLLAILPIFLPFFILLVFYIFTCFFDWNIDNTFCNIASISSFIAILIIAIRTIFDQNIIISPIGINLDFYTIQESKIKILLYLILISNLLLLYCNKKGKIKIHS